MKKYEFYVSPDGDLHVVESYKDYILTDNKKELVNKIDEFMQRMYRDAWRACNKIAFSESNFKDKRDQKFKSVSRFIRCNFGVRDNMSTDYDSDSEVFSFEEVPCPLRGMCKMEGTICKPNLTIFGIKAKKYIRMIIEGYEPKQIATLTKIKLTSVNHALSKARMALGVDSNNKLIRVLRGLHL